MHDARARTPPTLTDAFSQVSMSNELVISAIQTSAAPRLRPPPSMLEQFARLDFRRAIVPSRSSTVRRNYIVDTNVEGIKSDLEAKEHRDRNKIRAIQRGLYANFSAAYDACF